MNVVEQAVAPLKEDAMKRAQQDAAAHVERVRAALEAVDWDIDKAAPRPHSRMSRADYKRALAKHESFLAVTTYTQSSRKMSDPHIRIMSDAMIERFVKFCVDNAAFQYEQFVCKLVKKIGADAVDAQLVGNHVWSFSILVVKHADETVDKWKTTQIVNISSLGKLFNQWPTRKIK